MYGNEPFGVRVAADADKSIRTAARKLTHVGLDFPSKFVAPQLDSVQVGPETFLYSAEIELHTPGSDAPLALSLSRRQSLPTFENGAALFGQEARERAAERASARRILREAYTRLAKNVYIQVPSTTGREEPGAGAQATDEAGADGTPDY